MDAANEETLDLEQLINDLENGAGGEGGITFMEKSPRTPKPSTTPSSENSSTPRTPRSATAPSGPACESEQPNKGTQICRQVSQDNFPLGPPVQQNQMVPLPEFAYPSLQNLVEFRYDMLGSSAYITENAEFVGDSYTDFNNPLQSPHVFCVLESVCHYYSQPCCMYISGDWVCSQIQIPVAQHICISVDDGTKRYEEVIKLDLNRNPALLESPQQSIFSCVEHRTVRGNPSRRPRFRDILRRSLEETMRNLTDNTFEIIISRASGRCVTMDCLISQFFADSHQQCPYELFVGPLIQHIPQQLEIGLTAARFKVCGYFQRPVLKNATILLTRGDTQLFETICINHFGCDRKILAVALDSAFAKLAPTGESSSYAIGLIEAVSYADFGPTGWGLNVVSNNPRVAPAFHPFCNLQQNPLFNRNLNPYYSHFFHPHPAHAAIGYSQSPFTLYPCPMMGTQILQAQPLLPMLTLPSNVEVTNIQILPRAESEETAEKNQADESSGHDERSRSVSPRRREKKPLKLTNGNKKANGNDALIKLNPNAREYYPQGFGTHGNRFNVRSGPEEISVNELQTDSEDPVYISSVVKCNPIPAAKMDELQICNSNILEQSSTNLDISMYVNRSPFPNQSESRCSVLDPENTLELKPSRFKVQDMSVPPFRSTSWSEDMESHPYVEASEAKQRFNESYDNGRGRRPFKDPTYRGNDDWGAKHGNGNNRWSGGGRRQDGQANEYRQDLRAGHGFGTRDNHNGPRYPRGSNTERVSWGRGGRNNNGYSDRYYQRNPRQYDQETPKRVNSDLNETKLLGEPNIARGSRLNEAALLETCKANTYRPTPDNLEKATTSYADAARTNVSEELPAFTTPEVPENEPEALSFNDFKEDEVYNFTNRGYNRGNYQSNYRGNYRNYRRDYNYDYNNSYYDYQNGYQNQYSDQRNYNRRAYLNYPRRNQDNWNPNNTGNNKDNVETEEVQRQPNFPQKWNKYPTKNFQPNNRFQNAKRGGSSRGAHHQDVPPPSLNEFPPLHAPAKTTPAVKVTPSREPKVKKPAGSTNAKKKAKCFKKYNNREGSTSGEDVDNYLSDVIPRETKPASIPEEENSFRKDARGDGLFQADSTVKEKGAESQPQNAESVENAVENSRKEITDPRYASLGFATSVDHTSLTEYDADIEGGGEPRA